MKSDFLFLMDVIEDTTADGPGLRTSIYSAGCRHQCPGCHNPQSWCRENGHVVKVDKVLKRILDNPFSNVTFSGGDPMEQVEAFTELAKRLKNMSRKTIWCYTGYTFEEIKASSRFSMILPYIDVLVDGRFVESLRDESLLFRGSSNQRLIDVKASITTNTTRLLKYEPRPIEFLI